ncbi:MAG: AraC family transcriptional regulator [Bacteroidota bacterium]
MRTYFEQIDPPLPTSFVCKEFIQPHFDSPYHFHPEYELTYIKESYGKRFVGTHIANYYPGELVLLGKNVPHCWKDETAIGAKNGVHSVVIQFREDFLGPDFLTRPECVRIKNLLEKAGKAVLFHEPTRHLAIDKMLAVVKAEPFHKMIGLLELLQLLATSHTYELLLSTQIKEAISQVDCDRIHTIYAYVDQHFMDDISLNVVAAEICLTPSAFCRYFKKITNKTFVQVVTEYRIMHASKLLVHTSQSISAICFDCGFRNLSNFNKHFRTIMKMTPQEYRTQVSRLKIPYDQGKFAPV